MASSFPDLDAFCSPFDARLAATGPPAIFLFDPEGKLRFDPEWTRDAYGRADRTALGEPYPCWVLAIDVDSGYVQLVMATSGGLAIDHERTRYRTFGDESAAREAFAALGRPPLARD